VEKGDASSFEPTLTAEELARLAEASERWQAERRRSLRDLNPVPRRPMALERLLAERGIAARGIVHVGAHYGEELESYLVCGFERIAYVEANPAVFDRLRAHVGFWDRWLDVLSERFGLAGRPELRTVECAASDRVGHAALYVTEHDPQSSLLVPSAPEIRLRGTVEVRSSPLDRIVADLGWAPRTVNVLVLDAQGAEGRILDGAGDLLPGIDLAIVEVGDHERYAGGATEAEVATRLENAGLRSIHRTSTLPGYPVCDVVYARLRAPEADRRP
jgi:FkbM family methyltransferase